MKLEPLFVSKNNQLYKLADNSLVDLSDVPYITQNNPLRSFVTKLEVKWSVVELEPESYNEEFLAKLRDYLKSYDDTEKFVILKPVADKKISLFDDVEAFTNAMNHTARRIKDCTCVIGIELPAELLRGNFEQNSDFFVSTLNKKHAHYVYFASKKTVTELKLAKEIAQTDIVLY